MSHHHHDHSHGDLLQELVTELQPLFESSEQAIYVYFDDEAKACNEKFATLLGYSSAQEWAQTEGSFPTLFVDEKSQDTLINAYQKAMERLSATTLNVSWKKKSGGSTESNVILVPISFRGHLFALHFIS